MNKIILFLCLFHVGCRISTFEYKKPEISTSRFCDKDSTTLNIAITNVGTTDIRVKYNVYADLNNNRTVESTDSQVYSSPVSDIGWKTSTEWEDPIPIARKWNKFTLITVLQTAQGDIVKDHCHPCENHIKQ